MTEPSHLTRKRRAGAEDIEIGRKIRALRLERGLSQSGLADGIDLTFQQVQKYEKGVNRVSAGRLQRIADMLHTPVMFFYAGMGAKPKKDQRQQRPRLGPDQGCDAVAARLCGSRVTHDEVRSGRARRVVAQQGSWDVGSRSRRHGGCKVVGTLRWRAGRALPTPSTLSPSRSYSLNKLLDSESLLRYQSPLSHN